VVALTGAEPTSGADRGRPRHGGEAPLDGDQALAGPAAEIDVGVIAGRRRRRKPATTPIGSIGELQNHPPGKFWWTQRLACVPSSCRFLVSGEFVAAMRRLTVVHADTVVASGFAQMTIAHGQVSSVCGVPRPSSGLAFVRSALRTGFIVACPAVRSVHRGLPPAAHALPRALSHRAAGHPSICDRYRRWWRWSA
jgi:hypothetical protein